jgi:hypothetical protein
MLTIWLSAGQGMKIYLADSQILLSRASGQSLVLSPEHSRGEELGLQSRRHHDELDVHRLGSLHERLDDEAAEVRVQRTLMHLVQYDVREVVHVAWVVHQVLQRITVSAEYCIICEVGYLVTISFILFVNQIYSLQVNRV